MTKEIFDGNPVLKEILTEMCKRVGANYSKIDFKEIDWYTKYQWKQEEEESFKDWLKKYFTEDKKRLNSIAAFPRIASRNKKELQKVVNWFTFNYGWRIQNA